MTPQEIAQTGLLVHGVALEAQQLVEAVLPASLREGRYAEMQDEQDYSQGKDIRLDPGVTELLHRMSTVTLIIVSDLLLILFQVVLFEGLSTLNFMDFRCLVAVRASALKYAIVHGLTETQVAQFDLEILGQQNIFKFQVEVGHARTRVEDVNSREDLLEEAVSHVFGQLLRASLAVKFDEIEQIAFRAVFHCDVDISILVTRVKIILVDIF